jgi:hypothetical protein
MDSWASVESFLAPPEESFRNQTSSGDYRTAFVEPDADGDDYRFSRDDASGFGHGYDVDATSGLDAYREDDGYPADEDDFRSPPAAANPQFAQVYHQPYNQSHETLPAIDEEDGDPADEAYTYRLEDDERAAYLADYQRTLARDEYAEYSDEPDRPEAMDDEGEAHPEDDAYARAGGYDPTMTAAAITPRQLQQPRQARPVPDWTPPPANRPPVSAAPPSWMGIIPTQRTAAFPTEASSVTTSPISITPTPAPRLPVERPPVRRQAQRRPAPAARGFVPSQDRIGTAREVMTYLARRPWLQLDVVDIILGTQFDRDDVAHALIVLQQTGRIRSHLRGDRVCYSYAAM